MDGLFLDVLNMSISASWLILVVIIIRALLNKAPKGFRYILWILVAIRLICPFSLESALSLIPSAETVPEDIVDSDAPQIHTGVGLLDETINPIISENFSPSVPSDSVNGSQDAGENTGANENKDEIGDTGIVETPVSSINPIQRVVMIATVVWCMGILAMLIYTLVSYLQLWKKVKVSVRIQENVWISDEIRSPFILGIIRPRIYLPSHIEKEQMGYIIAHEKEHLRCLDYLWKPLGFLILTVHWFNPLVWVAYILLCRDIETACDERVIRNMDTADKRNYSEVLLACSSPRHFISACPVSFGEIGIKERIKKILTYKKPAVWIIGIAVVACVGIAVCFLTNPKAGDIPTEGEDTETESETESDSQEITLPKRVFFYGDVTNDGQDELITLLCSKTEGNNPNVEVRINLTPEYYESSTGDGTRYFLITYEGKKYLMSYMTRMDEYCAESDYRISCWENGERVQLAYDRVYADFGEMDYFDKNKWLEYAETVNKYLEDSCLLAGFEGKEFVYSTMDNPQTFHENFHWLIDGEVDETASLKNILDTFIVQAEEKYPKPYESVIYKTEADLTHDGIEDLVQTILYSAEPSYSGGAADEVYVRVYRGTGDGSYEADNYYESDHFYFSRMGNGTLCLTEKDGKDYLMSSVMYELQGDADYSYKVFYIDDKNGVVTEDSGRVSFITDPYLSAWYWSDHREDVVPQIKEQMTPWIENGIILVAMDLMVEEYISTEETVFPASAYYDTVWARTDDITLPAEVAEKDKWMQYLYTYDLEMDGLLWFEKELESDFSEWYTDYNGKKIQRLEKHDGDTECNCSLSENCDIIFYKAGVNEDIQQILGKMIEQMIIPRMTPSDIRPYTITEYMLPKEQQIMQISEHAWLVECLDGYYAYTGTDVETMEDRLRGENQQFVPFMIDGEYAEYRYLLIEEDGIYRLQKWNGMKVLSEQ